MKHLLSKCNQTDDENYYQNFEASFDSLSHKKNKFLDAVKSSIKDQLSEEIESNKNFRSIVQILNTEGWECKKIGHNGNTISDTHVEYLHEYFNIPLAALS